MNPTLILITGAGSGIGKALANYFQGLGFSMILIDRSEQSHAENFCSRNA
ncbi:SDR family NAD(P)-dependent oxidoreductase [Algoriphagus sp.]